MKIAHVELPNGMVVSCHQKHEVPIVNLEIQGYIIYQKHVTQSTQNRIFHEIFWLDI